MALRLRQAGVKVFLVATIPLAGASSWRGNQSEILWTGADGRLSSGQTFEALLSAASKARFVYVDAQKERARMPTDDFTNMKVDAFVLFRRASPMKSYCTL